MSNLNLPGFTAAVSLYKAINHYHMIGITHQADGTVHAAQIRRHVFLRNPVPPAGDTYYCCTPGGCHSAPGNDPVNCLFKFVMVCDDFGLCQPDLGHLG
jgi:hypothetical protein